MLALLISFSPLSASIINVPEDHETIQAGIDASRNGDTVLVQPGIYRENITFHERRITLASLFLTTGDETYIDSTIIDGGGDGTVVVIEGIRGNSSALTGFTIQNGNTRECGGGVYLHNSNTSLSHLIIRSNRSWQYGGGLYFCAPDSFVIRNITVQNNTSQSGGGGIYNAGSGATLVDVHILNNETRGYGGGFGGGYRTYFFGGSIVGNTGQYGGGIGLGSGPSVTITEMLIMGNHSSSYGGGLYISGNSGVQISKSLLIGNSSDRCGGGAYVVSGRDKVFTNVTIATNYAPSGGGIFADSRSYLRNCIIYKNGQTNISTRANTLNVAYSDVEGGVDGVDVIGEGNIDANPQFVNSGFDFNLTMDSPCIDSGDPESPVDEDFSRADMGGIPYLLHSILSGNVTDAESKCPIENCTITASTGLSTLSDLNGHWILTASQRMMDFTVSYPGYNSITLRDIQVGRRDTLSYDLQLTHPDFQASTHEIGIELVEGDSTELGFTLTNEANGHLEWAVETNTIIGNDYKQLDLRESISVSQEVDNLRIQGAVFANGRYYVVGRGDEAHVVYVLNSAGREVGRFDQPGLSNLGMHDLAWDGELIWGTDRTGVFGFTTDGTTIVNWSVRGQQIRNLAWDGDHGVLWLSYVTGGVLGYSREGELLHELERDDFRKYGLAYWPFDPDGYNLYVLHRERETHYQAISKINPVSGESMFVGYLTPQEGGAPTGIFITDEINISSDAVLMTISNASIEYGGDHLNIWHLNTPNFWIDINPKSGIILPGATREITVSLKTYDPIRDISLPENLYDAYLEFTHNATGGDAVIPVTMNVADLNEARSDDDLQPNAFEITTVYPNPFNSVTNITYSLPERSDVTVRIFDLAGRIVETLYDTNQTTGLHTATWDAGGVASGLYLVQVATERDVRSQKIILTK